MIKNQIIKKINYRKEEIMKNNFIEKQQIMLSMLAIENSIDNGEKNELFKKGESYTLIKNYNRYHQKYLDIMKDYHEICNYYEIENLNKILKVIEDEEGKKLFLPEEYYEEKKLSWNEFKKSEINISKEIDDKFLEINHLLLNGKIKPNNEEEMKKSIIVIIHLVIERITEINKKINSLKKINKFIFENTFDIYYIVNKKNKNYKEIGDIKIGDIKEIDKEMREKIIKYNNLIDIKLMEELIREDLKKEIKKHF